LDLTPRTGCDCGGGAIINQVAKAKSARAQGSKNGVELLTALTLANSAAIATLSYGTWRAYMVVALSESAFWGMVETRTNFAFAECGAGGRSG